MTTGSLRPGTMFAGFRVHRLLGSGGMSEVYLVERDGGAPETLKILNHDASRSENLRGKFVAEAELAGRLHHPNIVSVHRHGEEAGQMWMSMHYVEGYSAARLVARGQIPLEVARAARIVSEVAKGLDYAHEQGVLHRDVKPANILISTEHVSDGHEQVMLSDWGIARLLDDATPLASGGTVMASIHYAAPELLRGGILTARTDIYALGATLVELLTGVVPYPLSTPLAIMNAQLEAEPPRVTRRRPALSDAFDAVVATALAKNPADRFETCKQMSDAVAVAASSRPVPAHTGSSPRKSKWTHMIRRPHH